MCSLIACGEPFVEGKLRVRKPAYIELHANSAFSFLEGACLPEALVDRAIELGLPAIAVMDRNGLYGSARFHSFAKKQGLTARIGAEIAVSDLTLAPSAKPLEMLRPPRWQPNRFSPEPPRIPLLCATQIGYRNLAQMITRFKMREPTKAEGAAKLADLDEFAPGLIALTGGPEGPLAAALAAGGEPAARAVVQRMVQTFGPPNVYVELQRHGDRAEELRNQAAIRIAERLRLPLLATNGVKYARGEDREILDVFTCIRNGVGLEQAGRLLTINGQRALRSAATMQRIFSDIPEAIANTIHLADRLEFSLNDAGYEFPTYDVGPNDTMDTFLRKRVFEGVERRYGAKQDRDLYQRATVQVERELKLIAQLKFSGYFLIVWDIIEFCRRNDILVQGRGSAANSAVCYALGITAVDPVGMKLLFERFLSESRGEWPDIDLDLPSGDKREQAIQYVYQRYGELGAAMTANVITYRGKSAAREVGKALGFDAESLARLAGLVSQFEWRGKSDTMANNFSIAGFDVKHPRIAKYLELCLRMQDLPRHLGQHSGGMVICQGLLNQVVPLERASMAGRTVVQWDKEDCAEMGIVKVDLLGLGMMAVVKDCLDLVPRHYGDEVDLAQLPQDDEVYKVLCAADTVGMFQVESRAQMASLPRNAPKVFYDLVVQVAIIRPGPIVGKMMHPYMRRRQGREEVTYPHPLLKETLERTLGVPLFQEQLLRMAMVVANFSGSEAEELRKAVGMRRSMARMTQLESKLREGMTANGLDPSTQEGIIQSIQSFALYGFPESHAASFALIAYASAYLKVKYLGAFTCAILNNQPMGFYTPAVLVKDAQRHGLRVKPIDVQQSSWNCELEPEEDGSLSLRLGLRYVRGLRESVGVAMVRTRLACGSFRSTEDLTRRATGISRKEMVQLARVGALNWVGGVGDRRDGLWQVEEACREVGPLLLGTEEQRQVRNAKDGEVARRTQGVLRKMFTEERLVADYSGTGLTVGPHPMAFERERLRKMRVKSAMELREGRNGSFVRAAGSVIARQRPGTAMGFIFLSMEDETGISNVIIHPDLYERERVAVTRGRFLLIEGKLQNEDGVVHVKADTVEVMPMGKMEVRSHDFH
jgi:error-prone DNA polymerase